MALALWIKRWVEVGREVVEDNADPRVDFACDFCGSDLRLRYNGGELDIVDCVCGKRQFSLEHGPIFLVTKAPKPE